MKPFSYLLLLFLVIGCNSNSEEYSKEPVVQESILEIVEEIGEEFVVADIDSTFKLSIPDLDSIKLIHKKDSYRESIAYVYLREYYGVNGEKEEGAIAEWDSVNYCSFVQNFHFDIQYKTSQCNESGMSETITFPKIETERVKELINALFSTEDNTWVTNTSYEADGAGCYYLILQEDEKTTKIEIWCGC